MTTTRTITLTEWEIEALVLCLGNAIDTKIIHHQSGSKLHGVLVEAKSIKVVCKPARVVPNLQQPDPDN